MITVEEERELSGAVNYLESITLPDSSSYSVMHANYTGVQTLCMLAETLREESRATGQQYRLISDTGASVMRSVCESLQNDNVSIMKTTHFGVSPSCFFPYVRSWEGKFSTDYSVYELDPYSTTDRTIIQDFMVGSFGMYKGHDGIWRENYEKITSIEQNFRNSLEDKRNRFLFVEHRYSGKMVGTFVLRHIEMPGILDLDECQLHCVAGRPYEYPAVVSKVSDKLPILFCAAVHVADTYWPKKTRITFSSSKAAALYEKLQVPTIVRNGIVITPK